MYTYNKVNGLSFSPEEIIGSVVNFDKAPEIHTSCRSESSYYCLVV